LQRKGELIFFRDARATKSRVEPYFSGGKRRAAYFGEYLMGLKSISRVLEPIGTEVELFK